MSHYLGVDSWNPVTERFWHDVRYWLEALPGLRQRHESGFLDGLTPAFWGRYLRPPHRSAITQDEVDLLAAHGCRLLVVYNGPRWVTDFIDSGGSRRRVSVRHGQRQGERSAEYAARLATPMLKFGTTIFADLENWRVNPAWIYGWYVGLRRRGYVGGLYGDPRQWSMPSREDPGLPSWRPAAYGRRLAEHLADDVWLAETTAGSEWLYGPHANQIHVWSSRAVQNAPGVGMLPLRYQPRERVGIGHSVIWQYRLGEFGRKVDLNLATEAGLECM